MHSTKLCNRIFRKTKSAPLVTLHRETKASNTIRMATMRQFLVGLVTILLCVFPGAASPEDPGYQYFETGHPSSVVPHTTPGFALIGGGMDQDAAFRWMCN